MAPGSRWPTAPAACSRRPRRWSWAVTERAFPVADAVTQPFWDGIAEGVLRLQRCGACAAYVFYPRAVCPHCTVGELSWVDAAGGGPVGSVTAEHPAAREYRADLPYVGAPGELDEGGRL